jgi:hypothetical protein
MFRTLEPDTHGYRRLSGYIRGGDERESPPAASRLSITDRRLRVGSGAARRTIESNVSSGPQEAFASLGDGAVCQDQVWVTLSGAKASISMCVLCSVARCTRHSSTLRFKN